MPNTFGSPGGGFALVDPRCVREHRERFRRDLFPDLDRANSYYNMAGRWPDVGWLLLDRASYNLINPYATNLQLIIQDFANPPIKLTNLTVVQARCVTRGLPTDPAAIYLVQVTNVEGVLYNPWFQLPVTAQYNILAPAYSGPAPDYYSNTTNSGTPWTWDDMVGDLWAQAGGLLGTYPHLPTAPTGTPENFIFSGVPLWEAISGVLDYLGLSVSGLYPTPTITVSGAADAIYTALAAKYFPQLEDSMEYLDAGSGRVPSILKVLFHTRYQYYGTEETVRDDGNQWQTLPHGYGPIHTVTVNAPAQFATAAGTGYLWADFTVRLDMDGNALAADLTTAATIAAERTSQYFSTIYRGTQGFMRHVYGGLVPFTTGSLVDGVRWFNTGKMGSLDERHAGWRTEVIRGYLWPEVTFSLTVMGLTGPT